MTDPFPLLSIFSFVEVCWKEQFFSSHVRFVFSVETAWKPGATVVDGNLIPISTDSAGFRVSHFL